MKQNIWLKTVVGLVVSTTFLWFATRKIEWGLFKTSLYQIDIYWAIPAFLITILVCIVRAIRWNLLFQPVKEVRFSNLFSVIMIGFLANNVLPARLGDLVMAHFIGKKEGLSKSLALGTIIVDRVMDVVTLLILLTIILFFHPFPHWVGRIANLGSLFLVLTLSLIFALILMTDRAMLVIRYLLTPLPAGVSFRILDVLSRVVQGLTVLRKGKLVVKVLIVSLVVWFLLGVGVYCLFLSFQLAMPFWASFFVLTVVNLGLVIPSSPGFVGTFQFFCMSAIMFFGFPRTVAFSFSIVYHLSQYVPTTFVGFVCLAKENIKFRQLISSLKGDQGQ